MIWNFVGYQPDTQHLVIKKCLPLSTVQYAPRSRWTVLQIAIAAMSYVRGKRGVENRRVV
jgi:hypothetical protein